MPSHDVILRCSEGSPPFDDRRSFGTAAGETPREHREPTKRRWLADVAIVLYFAFLTLVLFGDLLTSSRAVVSAPEMDVDQQFFAWRSFAFGELRAGRLPLWNPYSFGGVPALGNVQYAILYPPNWLHVVLPTGRAINLIAALHVFLAGVLAAAWCRSRGSGVIASALGGTVFALGGPYILHLYAGHLTFACVAAWTPLIFLAVDRIITSRSARAAWLIGAFAVAMQALGGYPQPAYYAGLAVVVYAAVRLWRCPPRAWLRAFSAIAGMYAFGALLAAAQLLPALDAARESVRAEPLPFATAASYSLPPENLLTLLAPYPLGDDFAAPYAGRWVMWETSLFIGPAAVVLAILTLAKSGRRADRAALVVALLAIVAALGSHTPLFRAMYEIVPGVDRFRVPARFGIVAALMLAGLAARGFDLLWHRQVRLSPLALATLGAAALVACAGMVLAGRLDARTAPHFHTQLMRTAIVLAQAGVALLLVRRVPWLAYVMAVLLVFDLATSAGHAVQRFHPRLGAPPAWRGALASLGPDERVVSIAPAMANLAAQIGIEDAWGYDPAMPARWGDLVGRLLGANPRNGDFAVQRITLSPLWAMLRVRRALPPTVTFEHPPLPRAMLVDEAIVVDGPAASLAAVLEPGFDPRTRVVLESSPNPPPQAGAKGSVRISVRTPHWLEMVVELDAPAILLITDAYSADWRVQHGFSRTGAQTDYALLPANHALRAVPLAAGNHVLALEYSPRSVAISFLVSFVVWIAFFVTILVLLGRHLAARRPRP